MDIEEVRRILQEQNIKTEETKRKIKGNEKTAERLNEEAKQLKRGLESIPPLSSVGGFENVTLDDLENFSDDPLFNVATYYILKEETEPLKDSSPYKTHPLERIALAYEQMKQLQTKIQRTPTFILDKTTYHCGEEWEFGRNLIRFVSGVEWVLVRLEEGFPQIEFSNERPEAPRSPKITYPSKDQPTIEGVCVSNGGKIDFSGLFNASAEDKVLVKFKKDYQSLPFGIRSRGHDIDLFHSTRIITQLKEIREHLDEIDEYMRKERFWPIDRKKFNNQIRWAMEHLSEYLF